MEITMDLRGHDTIELACIVGMSHGLHKFTMLFIASCLPSHVKMQYVEFYNLANLAQEPHTASSSTLAEQGV